MSSEAHDFARRINSAWLRSVEAIFKVGRILIEAKKALNHGSFAQMIEAQLPFSLRTAERLMAIAADARIANTTRASLLPPSWSIIYELTRLPDAELDAAFADGRIGPDMMRADAEALGRRKLKILTEIKPSTTRTVEIETGTEVLSVRAPSYRKARRASAYKPAADEPAADEPSPDHPHKTGFAEYRARSAIESALHHMRRMRFTTIDLADVSLLVEQWPLQKRLEVAEDIERGLRYLAGLLTAVRS